MYLGRIDYVVKWILLVLVLLIGGCKNSGNRDGIRDPIDTIGSNNRSSIDSLESKDFTGEKVKFHGYRTNDTFSIETYFKGVLDGPSRIYDENGTLTIRASFKNGKLEGTYEDFYSNGKLRVSYFFHDDRLLNILYVRDSSGTELDFGQIKDGYGIVRTYLEMGQLESQGQYVDGYKEGYWKSWNGREFSDSIKYVHGVNQRTGIFEAI